MAEMITVKIDGTDVTVPKGTSCYQGLRHRQPAFWPGRQLSFYRRYLRLVSSLRRQFLFHWEHDLPLRGYREHMHHHDAPP